jgi:hypothetical protein
MFLFKAAELELSFNPNNRRAAIVLIGLSLSLSLSTLKLRLLAALMVSVWMKEQSIKRTTRISKARVFFAENYGSTGLTVVFNSFFVTGYLYKFDLFD